MSQYLSPTMLAPIEDNRAPTRLILYKNTAKKHNADGIILPQRLYFGSLSWALKLMEIFTVLFRITCYTESYPASLHIE